jgi:pyridoxal phosphate enzyme (YggS family)
MAVNTEKYLEIINVLNDKAALVAVSKTKPIEDIRALYDLGQRDFGENYVQELVDKYEQLPKDIRWHFIGHLQSNKVKYIAPFVHLIHGVDSFNLLKEIDKQAKKNDRIIDCLLQIHIAQEDTKFGLNEIELVEVLSKANELKSIQIKGLMGMASLTGDNEKIKEEFHHLKKIYSQFTMHNPQFNILSMGMSSDYLIALQEGSNMVRVGSLLFGERIYSSK